MRNEFLMEKQKILKDHFGDPAFIFKAKSNMFSTKEKNNLYLFQF